MEQLPYFLQLIHREPDQIPPVVELLPNMLLVEGTPDVKSGACFDFVNSPVVFILPSSIDP